MLTRQALGVRVFLGAGLIGIAASPILPRMVQQALFLSFGAVATVAIAWGIRRHRPARPRPWWLLMAGIGVAQTYTLIATVAGSSWRGGYPQPADWFYLLMYPLLIWALAAIPDPARRSRLSTGMLDAAVITCTTAVLSWTLLVDGFLQAQRMPTLTLATSLAYPAFGLLLAATVTRMAVVGGFRNPAHRLLMIGATVMIIADGSYLWSFTPTGPGPSTPLSVAGWMLSYICLAAAPLHPAMAQIGAPMAAVKRSGGRARIPLYALLVLIGPVVTAVNLLQGDGALGVADIMVPLSLTAATGVLLVVRSGRLANVAQRHADALNDRTVELETALSRQATLQEQLAHRALHDALTGLPNRALLRERLDRAVGRAGRHALLMLDLDRFKDVNDTLGHPVGDALLTAVGNRLGGVLDGGDTLARLGGDEFAILLEDVTSEEAHAVAERVLAALREPFVVAGQRLHVTASIGLLELTGD